MLSFSNALWTSAPSLISHVHFIFAWDSWFYLFENQILLIFKEKINLKSFRIEKEKGFLPRNNNQISIKILIYGKSIKQWLHFLEEKLFWTQDSISSLTIIQVRGENKNTSRCSNPERAVFSQFFLKIIIWECSLANEKGTQRKRMHET